MRYTLSEGIDTHEKDVHRRLLVSIPIVVALLFLALLGAHPAKQQPVVGPAYTSFSDNSGRPAAKTAKSHQSQTGTSVQGTLSGSTLVASTANPQASGSSLGTGGSSAPLVGGRGGGVAPSPAPSPPPATTPSVACDNSSGVAPITCKACTPEIIVLAGQKAVFKSDGGCILVN